MIQISFNTVFRTTGRLFLAGAMLLNCALPAGASGLSLGADGWTLPEAGTMVPLTPSFLPAELKGIRVFAQEPFRFDLLVDKGQGSEDAVSGETERLARYFLAALTIPEKEMWVNLSPHESDRIIPDAFGQTILGRDLLAQDYILKQVTATALYPDSDLGKKFWERVYVLAREKFGGTDIPVEAFNKVWITPESAQVVESPAEGGVAAFVENARLKVMLESDYLAKEKERKPEGFLGKSNGDSGEISRQVLREVVLPELEREVNEGENFARLRQTYSALVLATWYKQRLRESILGQIYLDQNKVRGVNVDDATVTEKIYQEYLQAFRKGAFEMIRDEEDAVSGEIIPRKYFSGGVEYAMVSKVVRTRQGAYPIWNDGNHFVARISVDPRQGVRAPSLRREAAMTIDEIKDSKWGAATMRLVPQYIRQINNPQRLFVARDGHQYGIKARPFRDRPDRVTVDLFRVDQPQKGVWEDVLFFTPEEGGISDVGVYTDGRPGNGRHENLRGRGIGAWLQEQALDLISEDSIFKIRVENKETIDFLRKTLFFKDSAEGKRELYFRVPRDKGHGGKTPQKELRVVDDSEGSREGEAISVKDVFIKSRAGGILFQSGLTDFVLSTPLGGRGVAGLTELADNSERGWMYPTDLYVQARKPQGWTKSVGDVWTEKMPGQEGETEAAMMQGVSGKDSGGDPVLRRIAEYYIAALQNPNSGDIVDSQGEAYQVAASFKIDDFVMIALMRRKDRRWFEGVFGFRVTSGGIWDVNMNLGAALESAEGLTGLGIGPQIFSRVIDAMPRTASVEMLVSNDRALAELKKLCKTEAGKVYFEKDGQQLEIVGQDAGAGQIGLDDVLKSIRPWGPWLQDFFSFSLNSAGEDSVGELYNMISSGERLGYNMVMPYHLKALKYSPRASASSKETPAEPAMKGGIDFDSGLMDLNIQKAMGLWRVDIDPAVLQGLRGLDGLDPVIMEIVPLRSVSGFLGLQERG